MNNYRDKDYALNKFSKGIVYRFADQIIEITLEDYLYENPEKSEEDFLKLKQLSDSIYLEQVKEEYNQTYKNISLNNIEETDKLATKPLEDMYIEQQEEKIFEEMIFKGLTEKQARRIYLCIYQGLSSRKIAELEGLHYRSIQDSLLLAKKKLEKFRKKF